MRLFSRSASRLAFAAALILLPVALPAAAIRTVSLAGTLSPSDDQSTGDIGIGFAVNFGGTLYSSLAVNTNGNLSFGDGGYGNGSPSSLSTLGRTLIAPFFADVDTRGAGTISYGSATVAGRQAFVVNYLNVGYYLAHTALTNSFQVVLFDRADTGVGNFDIEFNYDRISWETGDSDNGVAGKGGNSAVVGFTSALGTTQLLGSSVAGSFLDGGTQSLIANSLGNTPAVAGRYDFSIRNGVAIAPVPEPATSSFIGLALAAVGILLCRRRFAARA